MVNCYRCKFWHHTVSNLGDCERHGGVPTLAAEECEEGEEVS